MRPCFLVGLGAAWLLFRASAQSPCPNCTEGRLLSGNAGYSGIAVDAAYVYLADNVGAVKRVAKTGGPLETVATFPQQRVITGLDMDETNVFVGVVAPLPAGASGNLGTIARVPKTGGTFTILTDLASNVVYLAVDSAFVYWCSYGTYSNYYYANDGFVARVPKSGGAVQYLARNVATPYGLTLDGDDLYFGESGYATGPSSPGIKRVAKSGGAVTQIYSGVAAYVATDLNYVYATSAFSGEVFRVPKAGGPRTVYAAGLVFPDTIHVAGGQLFFACDDNCGPNGFVAAVDLTSGNSRILRSGLPCALPTTLDECALYVMSEDAQHIGALDRLCRPQGAIPAPTNTFSFAAPAYAVDEFGWYLNLTVQRAGDTNMAGSVSYRTADGTANAGTDYSGATNQLSFAPGETQKVLSLFLLDDTVAEPNETFTVLLYNPSPGMGLGANATAVVTILDNDAPGPGKPDLAFTNTVGTSYSGNVNALAIQSDGSCYIAGQFTAVNNTPRNYLARLKPDGSLDSAFDPGTGPSFWLQCLALQADGKLLIGGQFFSYNDDSGARYLARANTNGTLDTGFHPAVVTNGTVNTIALQPDGKILVGAALGYNSTNLARLNPDGSKDPGFNVGPGADGPIYTIVLDANGSLLVGGAYNAINSTPRTNLARLTSAGAVDPAFNPIVLGATYSTAVRTLLPLSNGKLLVGGSFTNIAGQSRQNLARLNADGSLDTSFNAGTNFNADIYALALQPDGKILVGGAFNVYGARNNYLERLNPDGSLDTSFDTGSGPNAVVYAEALLPSSQMLIGGAFTTFNTLPRRHIARLETGSTTTLQLQAPRQSAGSFGFSFRTAANAAYTVEASSNLISWDPIWSAQGTGADTNFTDLQNAQRPRRFYRLKQQN